jgi:uncharacterized OsmC-like protein
MIIKDSIEGSGYPLGFAVSKGTHRPEILENKDARDVFKVEARMLQGLQREGFVKEGNTGSSWRLTSDEGKHLKGTDLAPFPLAFFNAGLHSDLTNRILSLAQDRSFTIDDLKIDLTNHYWMTGSFFRGTGEGFSDPATVKVRVKSSAPAEQIRNLINDAVMLSPAMAAMRTPLNNTFALYVNGRRRSIPELAASTADDAPDPYVTYSSVPAPMPEWTNDHSLIRKTGEVCEGNITPAPAETETRIIRNIHGRSAGLNEPGVIETDTVVDLPGMTHFAIKSDDRISGDTAPCGMSLQAVGIAFCFMTQLGRYIEHMKFGINGIRLVQYNPYAISTENGIARGIAEPVDTHLFLNGRAAEADFGKLLHIAARTCYLHSTLGAALEPDVTIELNGAII